MSTVKDKPDEQKLLDKQLARAKLGERFAKVDLDKATKRYTEAVAEVQRLEQLCGPTKRKTKAR